MACGEIAELQETAGLTNDEMEYLRAKGLTLTKHLARCATSDEAFEKKVVQPFLEGIDIAGKMHKAGRDSEHVTAVMLVAFEEASKRRKAELKVLLIRRGLRARRLRSQNRGARKYYRQERGNVVSIAGKGSESRPGNSHKNN